MRILLFSDVHLDRPYEWAPPELAKKRREAAKEALVQVLAEARQRSVDVVACAGGLFHRDCVQPSNLKWLMTAFESVPLPVLIAPGDEDWLGPRSGYTQYSWPSNVTIFDSERLSPVEVADGFTVWGGAHRSADGSRSFLDRFQADRAGINIALLHASERKGLLREPASRPCALFDEEEAERAGLTHVLAGHYQLAHFGDRHTYPGALIAHDFNSGPSGGLVILEIAEDRSIRREFIAIPSDELHACTVDLSGLNSATEVTRRVKEAVSQLKGIARLSLTGRVPYAVTIARADLLKLAPKVKHLLLDTEELGFEIDLEGLSQESSVRGQFVLDVMSNARLSDAQRDRILAIGLRALDGQAKLEGLT